MAETTQATLAGFLLARNAEDAAEAHHSNDWTPERVLADCAARRKVVELHVDFCRDVHDWDEDEDPENYARACAQQQATNAVLEILAQPFADHPDFRQEWRIVHEAT